MVVLSGFFLFLLIVCFYNKIIVKWCFLELYILFGCGISIYYSFNNDICMYIYGNFKV